MQSQGNDDEDDEDEVEDDDEVEVEGDDEVDLVDEDLEVEVLLEDGNNLAIFL